MPNPKILQFAEWSPDVTPINTNVNAIVSNVVPRADGYGPMPSLAFFTSALPNPCRGVFFARNTDQSIVTFAATVDSIFLLTTSDNITFGWSLVGGPYSPLDPNKLWQFTQYNTLVIAVQGNVVPQVYQLGVSSAFAALGGSPPKAGHVTVVNQFIVLSDIPSNPALIKWSGNANPTIWTPGLNESDEQEFQDAGFVRHVEGGDQYGLVFQDGGVRSLTFAPGSPTVFNVVRIAREDGLLAEYSVVSAGGKVYYYSYQGFKVIAPSGYPMPIGKERVDRTFLADLDQDNLQFLVGATDPSTTRVYWPYKSIANVGLSDKIMVFDFGIGENGRWSLIIGQNNQFLTQLSVLGLIGVIPPGSKLSALPLRWFLGGFDSSNRMGTFSGPNLEAIIETPAQDLGDRYAILFLRPLTDAPSCFASIGKLDTAQQRVSYSPEQGINAQGLCPCRIETRYGRGHLRVPSGTIWSYAMGLVPDGVPSQGDR